MDRLHPPHLPFQTIDTCVAGAVGMGGNDHSHSGQSRKTQRELPHIEHLMMKRRGGRQRPNRRRIVPNYVFGGLS
jgi:hypothetical protein